MARHGPRGTIRPARLGPLNRRLQWLREHTDYLPDRLQYPKGTGMVFIGGYRVDHTSVGEFTTEPPSRWRQLLRRL